MWLTSINGTRRRPDRPDPEACVLISFLPHRRFAVAAAAAAKCAVRRPPVEHLLAFLQNQGGEQRRGVAGSAAQRAGAWPSWVTSGGRATPRRRRGRALVQAITVFGRPELRPELEWFGRPELEVGVGVV